MLSEFVIGEIGKGALYGVTYTMIFNEEKNGSLYKRCKAIKQEAYNCGFGIDEVFRIFEVSNGLIFDMDMETVKQVSAKIAEAIETEEQIQIPKEYIYDQSSQRRRRDLINLAKFLKREYDKGNHDTEVALYSRNMTGKIFVDGTWTDGSSIRITYPAFALRHWDMSTLNEKLLEKANIKLTRIRPCEILPRKTGVSFEFHVDPVDANSSSWGF